MPWTQSRESVEDQQSRILQQAKRWRGVTTRLARQVFQAQREAINEEIQHAQTGQEIEQGARQVLGTVAMHGGQARATTPLARRWLRFYRQVFMRIGAAFARNGVPPEAREERQGEAGVGTAWGPPGDPWWDEEFMDLFGGEEDWWDPWQRETLDYAETTGSTKVKQVNETTRRMIRQEVQAGLKAGESIVDLRARIDTLHLEQIIPNRSEVIGRTEALNAARAGDYHATRATGFADDTVKTWLATMDRRVRITHADASGASRNRNIPYNQPFEVRNPNTGEMEMMLFPGDVSMGASGANVIQCRCDVLKAL